MKRPPELRHAFAASAAGLVYSKHCVLVAVKSYWLAILEQIAPRGVHVLKGRLGVAEMRGDQLTRSIVDEDQEDARLSPVLEPPVIRTVNLDQLAEAWASVPWLLDLRSTLSPGVPDPSADHELADRLVGNLHAMPLKRRTDRVLNDSSLPSWWSCR